MSNDKRKMIVACIVKDGKTSKFSSTKELGEINFKDKVLDFGDVYVMNDSFSMLDIETPIETPYDEIRTMEFKQPFPVAITFKSGKTSMVKLLSKEDLIKSLNGSDNFVLLSTINGYVFICIDDIAVVDFINV